MQGTLLGAYRFDRYKPAPATPTSRAGLERLIVSSPRRRRRAACRRAVIVAAAQNRARDLGNTPPNDLTPTALADYAAELADRTTALTVTVLDGDEIRARWEWARSPPSPQGSDAGSAPDHARATTARRRPTRRAWR